MRVDSVAYCPIKASGNKVHHLDFNLSHATSKKSLINEQRATQHQESMSGVNKI